MERHVEQPMITRRTLINFLAPLSFLCLRAPHALACWKMLVSFDPFVRCSEPSNLMIIQYNHIAIQGDKLVSIERIAFTAI